MLKSSVGCRVVGAVALMLCASNAFAQATRTWVSGVGDDVNPCSRTAPCKTFAGAISKTAPGGEINAIDPGGFGAVTITKSITIDGGAGQIAGILNSQTNGVNINAAATDRVTLRNLDINGVGNGLNGIRVLGAGIVQIENCVIQNNAQKGIDIEPTTAGTVKVLVTDCHIQNNADPANGGGIFSKPAAAASVQLVLDRCRLHNNTFGLRLEDRTTATIRNSTIAGNVTHGVVSVFTAAAVAVNLESCNLSQNVSSGLRSVGAQSTIRYSNCMINNNALGLESVFAGALISYQNNNVGGNTADGARTGTIAPQ